MTSAERGVPKIKLNNGMEMPIIGFGTYLSLEGECEQSVKDAIDAGYRHIDTALFYGNEHEVGSAIRAKIAEGVIKREDIFVVSKLWNSFHDPNLVEMACQKSVDDLNVGPIDLYLMHWPVGYQYAGSGFTESDLIVKDAAGNILTNDIDYLATWKAMEQLLEKGLVRGIGVSNFNSKQIERILSEATVRPVTNQIEVSPNFNQKKMIEWCRQRDIVVTAYGPLGRPYRSAPDGMVSALHDPKVDELAREYGKTAAQIILRYLVQINVVPIPKSSKKHRIAENINLFDFELNAEDMSIMDSLNTNARITTFATGVNHKYFPFSIEF